MKVWFIKVRVNMCEFKFTHKIIADNVIKLDSNTIVADKVVIEFEETFEDVIPYSET